MSITTSTPQREGGVTGIAAPSRTTVSVHVDAHGRAAVRIGATGGPGRPRVRAMLLSSTTTGARVCLVPEGALLLGGDLVEIDVTVGPGASLELVEPAGTVAYDMRGASARWDVEVRVGRGGTLIWGGEPFVVSAGAHVGRTTRVVLADEARLALRETLVLGRHGETSGRLDQRLEVTRTSGEPVLVEQLTLDQHARPGVLGGLRVVSTALALGLILPESLASDGRFDLESGGVWWRRLGVETHRCIPHETWSAVRASAHG
ncbi:hypothetical protein BH09ACT12_BH09ACT12_06360 [soil metagenome]